MNDSGAATARLLAACEDLPRAWGGPAGTGVLKASAEDFVVEEELGFEPDGAGEHLFVEVEKRGLSTLEAQRWLARRFRLPLRAVAYSGMKDSRALTRQWFSLHLGVKAAREQATSTAEAMPPGERVARVLRAVPNSRKLQRGSHRRNRFHIRIRDFHGDSAALQACWARVQEEGAPNYFGPQRFGIGGSSLLQAWQSALAETLPSARESRSLQLSAARAFLFNRVLAHRVAGHSWNQALEGDLLQLAGSASHFPASREDAAVLARRLAALDVHVSGPLWGGSPAPATAAVAALEAALVQDWQPLPAFLETAGLRLERRALRLVPTEGQLEAGDGCLEFAFCLERGCYATVALRELLQLKTPVEPAH